MKTSYSLNIRDVNRTKFSPQYVRLHEHSELLDALGRQRPKDWVRRTSQTRHTFQSGHCPLDRHQIILIPQTRSESVKIWSFSNVGIGGILPFDQLHTGIKSLPAPLNIFFISFDLVLVYHTRDHM